MAKGPISSISNSIAAAAQCRQEISLTTFFNPTLFRWKQAIQGFHKRAIFAANCSGPATKLSSSLFFFSRRRRRAMGATGLLPPSSWRAVAAAWVALCLVPVVLSLAVLWLPLLCCAVAVVRFRRVRRIRRAAGRGRRGGGRWPEKEDDGGGDRGMLLQKYLQDQMELVGVEPDAVEFAADPPVES
uniref:Uncharacterized protein n=1 Tax=Oryza brachyantha TaxID=4533 RepID=J3NBS5_ORYBR